MPIITSTGASQKTVTDMLGRTMQDLRISVTDRCNFRCVYCMPKEVFNSQYQYLPHQSLLSFEEIERVARIFAERHGIKKIRLTGGEPLLRRHLEKLIEKLAKIPNIDLTLTTNGSILAKKAQALKDAGLNRITISLDSLNEQVFRAMNDVDFSVSDILKGIDSATHQGFGPLKINMVVKRGINDHTVLDMARYFKGSGHIVRFIEFMDVGATNSWRMDDVVPSSEIIGNINVVMPLQPIDASYHGEVAERWQYKDGGGEIGVISSVTQAFCGNCTRLRLSTDGSLYTCLFAGQGHDLKSLLRGHATDDEISTTISAIWRSRDDQYSAIRTAQTAASRKKIEMSYIGG